jgi:hypothetical protein
LAGKAKVGVATVRRAELTDGVPSMTEVNNDAIRRALEASVEFLDENGGGPGVRLPKAKSCITTGNVTPEVVNIPSRHQ